MKKGICTFFALLVLTPLVIRQTGTLSAQPVTTCENSNFNLGTFKGWNGCWGEYASPCEFNGFLTAPILPNFPKPLHKIIAAPGWLDNNTCDSLLNVFPGEDYVARLGDTSYNPWPGTYMEAEMSYQVTVTNDSYLFIYRYAVVLQTGGHNPPFDYQPDFQIMLTDDGGNVLDSTCGYYYITAQRTGPPVPGWHLCQGIYPSDVYWKDWTTVGMDLTAYFGQTIYITFKVRPCSYDTHFGYAYISAYCGHLQLQTALCEGDTSATLTAPPGFSYLWSTGDTTQFIVVPNPVTGAQYSCILTAINGCQVTITEELTYTVIHSGFTHGPACAGNPVQFTDTTWVNQNWVVDWVWDYGDGTPPDSGVSAPLHTFAAPGTYNVKLVSFSTEGCADSIVTQIVVDSVPHVATSPLYNTICSNDSTNLVLTGDLPGTLFTWTATCNSPGITGYSDDSIPTTILNQTLVNTWALPDTVFYTIYPRLGDCIGPDTTYWVVVNPLPVLVNPPPLVKTICDSTSTDLVLESNNDSTMFTWTCTAGPALSGYSDNTTVPDTVINQVLENSGFTTDTVYYHITGHSYGCTGDTTVFKVAVHPVPDLSNIPLYDSICNGTSPGITLTSHVAGAQFTWACTASSGNVTGYSNNAIPTTTLDQVLTNNGLNIEWVDYEIAPTANGCPGDTAHFLVYVNPVPVVTNDPMHKFQCSGMNTNISLTGNLPGTTFTWTASGTPGMSGFTDNPIPGTFINDVLVNAGNTLGTVTYHITPMYNGCPGNIMDFAVDVYPVPLLANSPPTQSQCQSANTNITLTSNVATTLFTWTCTQVSGMVTGWSANPGPPAGLISQVLDLTGNQSDSVIYHLTPLANGCSGPVTDFTVIVNPVPTLITNPMADTMCSGDMTNIILVSSCQGTTFTWTASLVTGNITGFSGGAGDQIQQTLTNLLASTGMVTYTITPSTPTCPGADTIYEQYVYPVPHLVNAPPASNTCSNVPFSISLISDVPGTQFTWTCTPSSANITGFSDNPVPTTVLNQTLLNTGSNIEWVTYWMIPRANSCDGPAEAYTVTVFPSPDVVFNPPSQSFCTGNPTGITLSSNVAGATFTWTASASSPNLSGYSAGSGNSIIQVLFNSGATPETVTYSVTPAANGCTGPVSQVVVTVNPGPLITTFPLTENICSGGSTNILLTSNVAGTTFSWIASSSSPNLSGYSGGSGNSIVQTIANAGFTIEWVTYQVTPTANGCTSGATDFTVTVNPVPDVSNIPMSSQICSGNNTNITLLSNVSGTTFAWSVTGSPNVTGYSPGSGPIISQVLTNLGFNPEQVVYHITPTANGCTGTIFDFTVFIVQTPDVFFSPPAQTICSGAPCSINILSNVPGASFTWTASASSGNVGGYSNGSGNVISQVITNSGITIEGVTYVVTPAAIGCPPGIPQDVTVTVNPIPAVSNPITDFSVCSGSTTNIVLQSTVAGTTYAWTASGSSPDVTGFSDGTGPSIVQTLVNTGFNTEWATYQVTPTANGCPGNVSPFVVTVFPVADVVFTPNGQSFCSGLTSSISLTSNVAGTTFTWTASGSGPSLSGYAAGSGNLIQQTLFNTGPYPEAATYQVAPAANGCPGISSGVMVTVNPFPVMSFSPCFDPVVSVNSQPVTLRGALPPGGTYSGAGVLGGLFNPATAGAGSHVIAYDYANTWGCAGNVTATITVVTLPAFTCGNSVLDVRDNQSYTTVQIGGQCWFAMNLNYGATIPSSQMQRDNCISEKYCFGDNPGNCALIGGMYQWDEMMNYLPTDGAQGFCPPEWHVPTEGDWNALFAFYISNGFAGSPLKYTGYSGFNAYLSGTRFNNVQFDFSNFAVMLWSSTSHGPRKAWAHGMNTYNPSVSYYPSHRNNAFWLRCILD